jgi:hypothetical protein
MHASAMLSRVKTYFEGSRLVRMSSGTYCLVRDLGLVKGGKGLRHHETLLTFSFNGLWQACRSLHAGPQPHPDPRPFPSPENVTPQGR